MVRIEPLVTLLASLPIFSYASTIPLAARGVDAAINARILAPRATAYWMETIAHNGTFPESWGGSSDYKVFRNVKDYGAVGDGVTDETEAIRRAMSEGGRESGTKPAVVYFPAGRYVVSDTIEIHSTTQVIGDTGYPEIVVTADFAGDAVFNTPANFFGQVRKLQVNMKAIGNEKVISGIIWRGGKGSGVYDVVWYGTQFGNPSGQTRGVTFDKASGGVFTGGWYKDLSVGFYGTADNIFGRALTLAGCTTAAHITGGFESVFTDVHVVDSPVAFRLTGDNNAANPTSFTLMDTLLQNVGTGVLVAPLDKSSNGNTPSIVLENLGLNQVEKVVADTAGSILYPLPDRKGSLKNWTLGPSYKNAARTWLMGNASDYTRESSLLSGSTQGGPLDNYAIFRYPEYETARADTFVHVKSYGAKGDGVADDTEALQAALDAVADGAKILYVDAGVYMVSDTVTVPKNARVTGEAWATIAGFGDKFNQADSPKAVLRVGNANDVGKPQLSSLIVTTKGAAAGAIVIEWNVNGGQTWDVHVKLGGTSGSEQTANECAPGSDAERCRVAALMFHITPKASGYFESMILEVAETDYTGSPISLYTARGLLAESRTATWLYSVHISAALFYNINIHRSRNIAAFALSTSSSPAIPPAPFSSQIGLFSGDPDYFCFGDDFDGCDAAWGGLVSQSQAIILNGVVSVSKGQKALWKLDANYQNVRLGQYAAVGAENVLFANNRGVKYAENEVGGFSRVAVYDAQSRGVQPN